MSAILFLRFKILDVICIDDKFAFVSSLKYIMAIQFITSFSLFRSLSPVNLRIMHKILKKELKHWDQLYCKLLQYFWHFNYRNLTKKGNYVCLPKYEELCELRDLFGICANNGIYLTDMFVHDNREEDEEEDHDDDNEDFHLNNLFYSEEVQIDDHKKSCCICF